MSGQQGPAQGQPEQDETTAAPPAAVVQAGLASAAGSAPEPGSAPEDVPDPEDTATGDGED